MKMFDKIKNIFKKRDDDFTSEELNQIAQNGVSRIGLFSEETLYNAFLEAGLSPDKAREEAKKRAWHID